MWKQIIKINNNNKIVEFKWKCFENGKNMQILVIFISSVSILCDCQGVQNTAVSLVCNSSIRQKRQSIVYSVVKTHFISIF